MPCGYMVLDFLVNLVSCGSAIFFFRALLMRTVAKILIRTGNARLGCLGLKMSSRHVTVPSQTVPEPASVWSERFRGRGAVPSFIASGLQKRHGFRPERSATSLAVQDPACVGFIAGPFGAKDFLSFADSTPDKECWIRRRPRHDAGKRWFGARSTDTAGGSP